VVHCLDLLLLPRVLQVVGGEVAVRVCRKGDGSVVVVVVRRRGSTEGIPLDLAVRHVHDVVLRRRGNGDAGLVGIDGHPVQAE
jgi:hypothetical protein